MPLPLAIPIAIGAYELAALAAAAVAAAWLASPPGQEASRKTAQALSEALSKPKSVPIPLAPAIPRTCPRTECDDKCGPLLAKINKVMAELRRRITDMEIDEYNLYNTRPAATPGIGSWPGHLQQFRNKQAQLRRLLAEASTNGCPIPPGAWHLATRNPPKRPLPK